MFTIIISEKGGAERREAFEKNEINVGRVQGNDLMLAKGNVSKHHARLLYRDGRFIVTDLKSTNGTYVNGRKISQATIVREGDKIYVGDFVLRLEPAPLPAASESAAFAAVPNEDSQGRTPARQPAPAIGRDPNPAPPATPSPPAMVPLVATGLAPQPPPAPPTPAPTPRGAEQGSLSHYPLERDPEESESGPDLGGGAGRQPAPPAPLAHEPRSVARSATAPSASRLGQSPGARSFAGTASARALPRETPQQAARRLALITLVDRVADGFDMAVLDRITLPSEELSRQIEGVVREQARAMREEGEAPEALDLELLVQDAVRELVGLGPIGPLLDDDEASEIHISRPDYLLALNDGRLVLADPSFTSEVALARTVARLAQRSGQPLQPSEVVVERRLGNAAHLVAISPAASSGWVLSVRKRRRVEATLEDLVRAGAMSRTMATFLEGCVQARANILVVGAGVGVASAVLAALASAVPAGERVVVLQDAEEIAVAHAQVIPVSLVDREERGEEAVRAASRLGADRLIVLSLSGHVAAATMDAIGEGCEGVLAGLGAPSLRHGLARLSAQVAMARPGTSLDAAREAVGESFDVAVEMARLPDGRVRVLRMAELAGSDTKGVTARDVFALSTESSGDLSYTATGHVPRFVDEFAARGVKLQPSLFKRR